jgi:hypothetical protein
LLLLLAGLLAGLAALTLLLLALLLLALLLTRLIGVVLLVHDHASSGAFTRASRNGCRSGQNDPSTTPVARRHRLDSPMI